MSQLSMLQHVLSVPSNLYESLTTFDLLKRYMLKLNVLNEYDVDFWFDNQVKQLIDDVEAMNVSMDLFKPLFIEREIYQKNLTLNIDVDHKILMNVSDYNLCTLGVRYVQYMIDFYNLKQRLFLQSIVNTEYEATLSMQDLMDSSYSVETLIFNSVYYKELQGLTQKNYDVKTHQAMVALMKPDMMDANSENGLFSKMFFKLDELQTLRARMKSIVFGLDEGMVLSTYE